MYPSLNSNGSKPQRNSSVLSDYYTDNIHLKGPQEHYNTPSYSSFLPPSPIYIPLEDEAVFCEFFQQQQFFFSDNILAHEMTANVESALGEHINNNGQIATDDGDIDHCDCNIHVEQDNYSPRKRPSNRDRHSKINTARGPRDRRMRLSLDVAKKLFGLQDLLGFDKASKTIDWLLTESKTAILDLLSDSSCSFMGVSNSATSTSECEVVPGTDDQFMVKTGDDQATKKSKAKYCSGSSKKPKEKITKETRVRARQRAKERTIEKRNNYKHVVGQDTTFRVPCLDPDVNHLGSLTTFQESQRQIMDQLNQMSSNFQYNQGFVGDGSSLLMTDYCTPSYFFENQD